MLLQIARIDTDAPFDHIKRVFADYGLHATAIDTKRLNDGALTAWVFCEPVSESAEHLVTSLMKPNITAYNQCKANPDAQHQLWFGENKSYSIRLVEMKFE
jgi:hypothetical protein